MRNFYCCLILAFSFLLIGCSSEETNDSGSNSDSNFNQVTFEKVDSLMNGDEDGFLLVIKDLDEYYIPFVKQAADDKGVNISLYHTHQPEGPDTEEIESPNFKYANKLKGSRLFYIKDGDVAGSIRVNSYADTQLLIEIQNFIEVHQ